MELKEHKLNDIKLIWYIVISEPSGIESELGLNNLLSLSIVISEPSGIESIFRSYSVINCIHVISEPSGIERRGNSLLKDHKLC